MWVQPQLGCALFIWENREDNLCCLHPFKKKEEKLKKKKKTCVEEAKSCCQGAGPSDRSSKNICYPRVTLFGHLVTEDNPVAFPVMPRYTHFGSFIIWGKDTFILFFLTWRELLVSLGYSSPFSLVSVWSSFHSCSRLNNSCVRRICVLKQAKKCHNDSSWFSKIVCFVFSVFSCQKYIFYS